MISGSPGLFEVAAAIRITTIVGIEDKQRLFVSFRLLAKHLRSILTA